MYSYISLQSVVNRLFCDSDISHGSVATYATSGGIFSDRFTANLPRNPAVQKHWKSVKVLQNYGHEFVVSLFWPAL